MAYPITDSVLRRHYEQHLSTGGAELGGVALTNEDGYRTSSATGGGSAAYSAANDHSSASRSGNSQTDRHTADQPTRQTTDGRPSNASSGPMGFLKVIIPLLIVGLLGWFAMKFMGNKEAAVDTATQSEVSDVSAVGDQLSGFFTDATDSLNGVTDADSATAAVPTLTSLGDKLGGISESVAGVSEDARGPLTDIVTEGTGGLSSIIEKLYAIPGVEGILKPVLGPIMEKLGGMAG